MAVFKYPVEFIIEVADFARDQGMGGEGCASVREVVSDDQRRTQERWLQAANHGDDGAKKQLPGSRGRGRGRIVGSVRYFKDHPDDIGAMVHETTHIVQRYRNRNNPGWLVEGVSDYVRFFKYEPGKLGRIDPDRAHYNGSYRTTAAFLAYLTEKIRQTDCAEAQCDDAGRQVHERRLQATDRQDRKELDDEWRATLHR